MNTNLTNALLIASLLAVTLLTSGCSSKTIEKIKTYDTSAVTNKAKKAYKDLDNELKK